MIAVEHWDEVRNGPLTESHLRQTLASRGYRVARYVYPPGTVFPDHTHGIDKIDAVVSGRFKMATADAVAILGPGDCVAIPRGVVHRAEVLGAEPVISLDATLRAWPDWS